MFFTGDFNGHSQYWWSDGSSTPEGREIDDLTCRLGLSQLISEPTNFEPNKNPSCIDLIFTDQPNIVLDSGTRPSLDQFCHHQIVYCRTNFKIPPPPPFERQIWDYESANVPLIRRAIMNFPWEFHFRLNDDPNWQVKTFTSILLDIMSNFIPSKLITINSKDPPWVTKSLKRMLSRQNRQYKNYKKHGFKREDKVYVDSFRKECEDAVHSAKENYFKNTGSKLAYPSTNQKSY